MVSSQLVISLTISLPHFELIVFNNEQIVLRYGYWVLRQLFSGFPGPQEEASGRLRLHRRGAIIERVRF